MQHAVDYFIVDFTVASESLVGLLADPTESKLTVDASGRGVRGCWVLNRPSTPPTLLWCCVWSLVVNNCWLLTLTPTTLCISISAWSYIYSIVGSDVYDNGIKSHKY